MKDFPVVFFDGQCNLCNSSVQLLLRLDKKTLFRFASLQSAYAKKELSKWLGEEHWPDSIVLLADNQVYVRSDAVLKTGWLLGGFWKLSVVGYLLPRSLRDYLYDRIAANRYRWFGKRAACMVPTPELKSRFLG